MVVLAVALVLYAVLLVVPMLCLVVVEDANPAIAPIADQVLGADSLNDPAGLAAGRNIRSYLIQSYARDMGNGQTIMMREIDVPIRVNGRHWGGFRTAYKI